LERDREGEWTQQGKGSERECYRERERRVSEIKRRQRERERGGGGEEGEWTQRGRERARESDKERECVMERKERERERRIERVIKREIVRWRENRGKGVISTCSFIFGRNLIVIFWTCVLACSVCVLSFLASTTP
jgi:hypothetical protein